jgi:hypothetical protein
MKSDSFKRPFCISDCFKQSGQKIELEIHNDTVIPENQIKLLIPIIEKVCLEYIEKRFPNKIPVVDKNEDGKVEGS